MSSYSNYDGPLTRARKRHRREVLRPLRAAIKGLPVELGTCPVNIERVTVRVAGDWFGSVEMDITNGLPMSISEILSRLHELSIEYADRRAAWHEKTTEQLYAAIPPEEAPDE